MSNEVKSGILEKKGQKYFPVTDVSLVQGLQDLLSGKQEALVSGENIKTINGESILGSGNIESASAYYLQGTINLTSTPPTATITSGSYAEVVEAYNAGSPVYIAMEESNGIVNVYPLAIIANGFIAFAGYGDDSFIVIVVPSTNSPEVIKAGIVHPEDISQFITNSVNNLVNYYTKTETYTKTEVAQLIANTLAGSFVSVNVLPPTPTADNLGKIYLVPSDVPDENNIKNEFIVEERNGSYYWEQIGSTTLNLDGYATTEDLEEAIDNVPFAEGAGTDSAEQWNCSASGNYSVASGYNTTAKGQASHSEGYDTNAAEQNSHAEGYHTTANGANAHIEGRSQNKPTDATIAKNNNDLITDWNTKRFALAKGNASHVEGYNNLGLGNYSHAEGAGTIALGAQSHAEGNFTQTTNANEHAEGQWNQSNTGTIHSIGIGANANTRKNAFEVMSNGDAYLYGVGGYDGTNPGAAQDLASAISTKYTKPSTGIPASDLSDAVKYADELEISVTLDEQSETTAYVLPADFANIFTYKPKVITVTIPGEGQTMSFTKVTEMPNYDQQDHSILLYGVSTGDTNIVLQIAENAPTVDGKRQVSVETMGVENVNHKVTTLSSSSDDMQYPSAKCVYDAIQASNTPEIFWATYGTTTAAEIDAAIQAGKVVMCRRTIGTAENNYRLTVDDTNYYWFVYGQTSTISWAYLRKSDDLWVSGNVNAEQTTNKVTSWQSTPDNTHYPSEQLVYDSLLASTLIPDMDNLKPIQTIEYDVDTSGMHQLFERQNPSGTDGNDVVETVACRITVTGNNMSEKQVTDLIAMLPGRAGVGFLALVNPKTPDVSAGNKYGIQSMREFYAKNLGTGYGWGIDYDSYTSSTVVHHLKIEIFKTANTVVFPTSNTASTYNGTYHGATGVKSLIGPTCLLNLAVDINGSSTTAAYLNGYLNSFIPACPATTGEALTINDVCYFSTDNKLYKGSTTNVPISPDSGIHIVGNSYNANVNISFAYLRQKVVVQASQPTVSHGTFTRGEEIYLRCHISNGVLYSDGILTNAVAPGYTWISIGKAESASQLTIDTVGKQFFTLDASGKLTHINGREINSPTPIATTQPAGGLLPNIVYDLGTLSGNTTFALATPADANVVNHYYWTFDTGSTAPTITWPSSITWFGGSAPYIDASKHYEISVLNGIGVAMEV